MKLNEPEGVGGLGEAEFLSVGEIRKALFKLIPGLKEGIFDYTRPTVQTRGEGTSLCSTAGNEKRGAAHA